MEASQRTFTLAWCLVALMCGCGGGDSSDAGAVPLPPRSTVPMPDGTVGIGFDDLQYSATLDRVVAPAGRAGYVGLVDPATEAVTRLGQFSTLDSYAGGHDFGTTSAIEVEGMIYAIDRETLQLVQLDADTGATVSMIALTGAPDYVRYAKATRELWITQPSGGSRFQIVKVTEDTPPVMQDDGVLAVAGGPESFVLNETGDTGYTNTFLGTTIAIDIATRTLSAPWSNGCSISLGIAFDAVHQRVFVGCAEGKAVALDAVDGTELSTLTVGAGVDIISYNPMLSHLYLNGSTMGQLTVADVTDMGELSELMVLETAPSTNSSCVLGDPHGNIWVCDANAGQLFRITDSF